MSDLSEIQLSELKGQLLQLKAELGTLIGGQHQKAEPVKLDQQAVGRVSRIDAIQQQEMAKANEQQTIKRLKAINGALKRFDNDEYGDCEQCGEVIRFARLKIKPEAEYCIHCQSTHD
jgi:DnaK suppressor protein